MLGLRQCSRCCRSSETATPRMGQPESRYGACVLFNFKFSFHHDAHHRWLSERPAAIGAADGAGLSGAKKAAERSRDNAGRYHWQRVARPRGAPAGSRFGHRDRCPLDSVGSFRRRLARSAAPALLVVELAAEQVAHADLRRPARGDTARHVPRHATCHATRHATAAPVSGGWVRPPARACAVL
jgi:hypothetical protein